MYKIAFAQTSTWENFWELGPKPDCGGIQPPDPSLHGYLGGPCTWPPLKVKKCIENREINHKKKGVGQD